MLYTIDEEIYLDIQLKAYKNIYTPYKLIYKCMQILYKYLCIIIVNMLKYFPAKTFITFKKNI